MKAIILKDNGGVDNLVMEDIQTPVAGPGELLIQTKAVSINPVDIFLRENKPFMEQIIGAKTEDQVILGWDLSGIVAGVGEGVTTFKKGDEVFGMVNFTGHGKTYAEYVVAPAGQLAHKPVGISHAEAAAATLAALTAWESVVVYGKIKKGDKVLIHAAAGGVGHYAVQIARHFGAYVIGTGSASSKDFILSLGADEFIDYNQEKFEEKVKDADLVIDSLFGDHLLRSLDAVKNGGRVVSLVTFFEGAATEKARMKNVFTHREEIESNGEEMKKIAGLLAEGALHSHVSATYSFDEIKEAHKQVATGKTRGKVVVTL